MVKLDFKGLMAPVFTAFTEENHLNVDIVPKYAEYLANNNIKGVLVNGTTGEGVSMTTAERKVNLEAWMKVSNQHSLTVMAQVGGTCFADVVELATHAERLKVDALLCLPELFFYPHSVAELVDYMHDVSRAAPTTPLFYYHIPMFTRVTFDMEEFVRECLSRVPTFRGIKFTHTNLDELSRAQIAGAQCFLGCDQLILPGLLYGCHSHIATSINLFPWLLTRLIDTVQSKGFNKDASQLQDIISSRVKYISSYGSWVSTMKPAMELITGIKLGPVRKPNRPLSEESLSTLKIYVDNP